MKNQIVSFLNALFATIFNLVSNPQRVRLLFTVAVIALILADRKITVGSSGESTCSWCAAVSGHSSGSGGGGAVVELYSRA